MMTVARAKAVVVTLKMALEAHLALFIRRVFFNVKLSKTCIAFVFILFFLLLYFVLSPFSLRGVINICAVSSIE